MYKMFKESLLSIRKFNLDIEIPSLSWESFLCFFSLILPSLPHSIMTRFSILHYGSVQWNTDVIHLFIEEVAKISDL